MNTDHDKRRDYIAGLRTIADLLEQNPDLPLPYTGAGASINWIEVTGGVGAQIEAARTFARVIPGSIDKQVRGDNFDLIGRVHGVTVQMIVRRDAVCTRRVVSTREVTEEVPDPDALAAIPKVVVTRTVEDVEWDCFPVLAPREVVSA